MTATTGVKKRTARKGHRYIAVHENGKIETLVCGRSHWKDGEPVEGSISFHVGRLINSTKGCMILPNKLVIWWSDNGRYDGSKINKPVSRLLGFDCFGPCVFTRDTQYSDGLTDLQYEALMEGLRG